MRPFRIGVIYSIDKLLVNLARRLRMYCCVWLSVFIKWKNWRPYVDTMPVRPFVALCGYHVCPTVCGLLWIPCLSDRLWPYVDTMSVRPFVTLCGYHVCPTVCGLMWIPCLSERLWPNASSDQAVCRIFVEFCTEFIYRLWQAKVSRLDESHPLLTSVNELTPVLFLRLDHFEWNSA